MEYRVGSISEAISGKSTHGTTKVLDFVPLVLSEKKEKVGDIKQSPKNLGSRIPINSNAQRRIEKKKRIKQNKPPAIHDADEEARTIFIGNLPNNLNKLDVKKHFRKYGKIENIRFRCAPIADLKIPKRIAVIKQEFHPNRTTINAFIRFLDNESAKNALASNGDIIDGHHIRVDLSLNGNPDFKKSIFLGNIPVAAEEEEIWKLFEDCGKVNNVRLIRDRQTGMSKGFGYVNFDSTDAVELAIRMNGEKLKGRELRIQRCKHVKRAAKSQSNARKFNSSKTQKNMNKDKKLITKEFVNKSDTKVDHKPKPKPTFGGRQALSKNIKKRKRPNKEDKKRKFIQSKLLPKEKNTSTTSD